ncbi:hypothetical protein D3C81_1312140 [compost metagenome]
MLKGVCTTAEAHIDQYLRALAQRLTSLRQTFIPRAQRDQHLQRSNDCITRGGVTEAHDVSRVFTTHDPVALQQFGNHIAVTDIGTHEGNTEVSQGQFQPQVTHQGSDHAALQLVALMQITGNDEQQLVAIDHRTRVVDHLNAIAITIEGDTQISMLSHDGSLQRPHVGRTAIVVDVQPVRLRR